MVESGMVDTRGAHATLFKKEGVITMASMRYRLLDGEMIDLGKLPKEDLAFLLDLQQRAMEEEDYFEIERAVCGPGAYPLKRSLRVTSAVRRTPLFRAAEDVAYRAGIRQGVVKAAQAGRLKGKKIGNAWAILKRSVKSYQVAEHRVAAGKAAHRR